jgi:hypothetical protein
LQTLSAWSSVAAGQVWASPQWFVDVMQVQECTSEAARGVMRVLKFAGVGAVALA